MTPFDERSTAHPVKEYDVDGSANGKQASPNEGVLATPDEVLAQIEADSQKVQEKAAKERTEVEASLASVRRELEEKQRQRAEATEQNAKLAEKTAELESSLSELRSSLEVGERRIHELESEKQALKNDLDRIMGNLSRW